MTKAQKKMINEMKYIDMLRKWRHTSSGGDSIFQGESGLYYDKVMTEKAKRYTQDEKVAMSKQIGW